MIKKRSFLLSSILAILGTQSAYAATPVNVTASSHDGNLPANTVDNDLNTRWSANGDGHYVEYDLGAEFNIDSLDIAFYKGDQRVANFDVLTSSDQTNWATVFSGVQALETLEQQNIALDRSQGQYVRIVGHGNSANSWNSITEVDINTSSIVIDNDDDDVSCTTVLPEITITTSADDGNVGDNVQDGNFDTRWSANGDGQWIMADLDGVRAVKGVDVAFFKGDQRSTSFDIETSVDGNNWTVALSNEASSGSSLNFETFTFSEVDAQYVRYVGHGNSSNTWNSITEFFVMADYSACGNNDDGDADEEDNGTGGGEDNGTGGGEDNGTGGGGDNGGDTGNTGEGNNGSVDVTGATYTATPDSLNDVLDSLSSAGGDEIIVTGSGEISLKAYSFEKPVLIRAATIGGTVIDNATITNANNIALQGFIFGPNEESTLLKIVNSTNIKVLRNLFDHKDITESQTSIVMTQASQHIEIAYNTFKDKNISDRGEKVTGSFIKTQYDGGELMTKNLHIHHNHFDNIAPYLVDGVPAGDSDREVIAMGIADSQDVVTNNLIEYNLFENCDGENEIITVKTSNNVFRYNTFKNSMGSLSFRLGSNNEAYGNYFYGTGAGETVADENYQTGGVRIYGAGHKIYDNYMENLTGISWRRPILVDSGDTSESTGNDSHETSTNAYVANNTIVNSVGGGIHIGGDRYTNMPTGITITNNTVVSDSGILFNNVADKSSNTWSDNRAYATGDAIAVEGGTLNDSQVEVLSSAPSISKPTPLTSSDVGRTAP